MNAPESTSQEPRIIKPRKMGFDMSQLQEEYFFRDNPIICTLMNAMEEIEHKVVAFDVYRATVDDERQRIMVARIIFRTFWTQTAIAQLTFLWHDRKIPTLKQIREAWNYMWGKEGFQRWAGPEFNLYLKPGFHPNSIDQSHLLEQWPDQYTEVAALQLAS